MEIQTALDGSVLNVEVTGTIDTVSSPEFESAVVSSLDGVDGVVFDFSALEYITSAGLRVLLTIHKKVNGNVTIRGARKEVVTVLDTTGFITVFKME